MSDGDGGADEFGTLLRQLRSVSGLTQEELAARSRLSVRAIADMERGRTARPYRSSVRQVADALGLSGPDRELLTQAARPTPAKVSPPRADAGSERAAGRIPPGPAVPRQLPAPVPHFAGREAELRALTAMLETTSGAARA